MSAYEVVEAASSGRVMETLSKSLRAMFTAEPGCVLVGGDFSNIEGRISAWLTGERWKLDAFREYDAGRGADLYRLAFSRAFGVPIGDVDGGEDKGPQRQVGKAQELACLDSQTLVLTNNGYRRIVDVRSHDLLWDGIEWVRHEGLVAKGVRRVVNVNGIWVTPSHQIIVGRCWREANELVLSQSALCQALESGSENLPSQALNTLRQEGSKQYLCNAVAVRHNIVLLFQIFEKVQVRVATLVQEKCKDIIEKTFGPMLMWYPMMHTDVDFLTEYQRVSIVVTTPKTKGIKTMGAEAYTFLNLGEKTNEIFWHILHLLRDGINQNWNLIEKTWTKATNRATYGSSQGLLIMQIAEKYKLCKNAFKNWKKKTRNCVPVYDILNSGPRHRFTVKTNDGHLICHNCQFGGSVGAYLRFVSDVSPIVATVKDVSFGNDAWRKACEQHDRLVYHNGLAREDWVAVKVVVNAWREAHPATVEAWWARADGVLEAVEAPGTTVRVMGGRVSYLVADGFLWARLPSGKLLAYSSPRVVERKDRWIVDEDGSAVSADEMAEDEIALRVAAGATLQESKVRTQVCYQGKNQKTGQWGRQYLYGGSLSNNDVQSTARELLRFAMGNVEAAGYPIVLHVHDELVAEVRQELGSAEHFEELMSILPPWLAGLPLAAKAWTDKRYVK